MTLRISNHRGDVRYAEPAIPAGGFMVGDLVHIVDRRDGSIVCSDKIRELRPWAGQPWHDAYFESANFCCSTKCLVLVRRAVPVDSQK